MTTQYTLFDIPTKSDPPVCWSPNTWKARSVLNYKGVPYETEWVEYPDIRVRLAEFGIPSKGGLMPYTLPMLRATITPPDGGEPQVKYLTDSADIVKYIADNHPEPPFDYSDPVNQESVDFLNANLMDSFQAYALCEVPEVLPERSAKYFHETRPLWMMMPIPEYQKKLIGEGAWQKLEVGMKKLGEFLGRNGGPFLLGGEEKICFGDMRILGFILWAQVGAKPEIYQKMKEWGGENLDRFLKAMEEKKVSTRATY